MAVLTERQVYWSRVAKVSELIYHGYYGARVLSTSRAGGFNHVKACIRNLVGIRDPHVQPETPT